MPDHGIKGVNDIGKRNKQGRQFQYLNQRKEPYKWTDEVPKDDPDFQDLLEDTALYPDAPAELPGVILEDNIDDNQVVTDKPEPDLLSLQWQLLRTQESIPKTNYGSRNKWRKPRQVQR